MSFKVCRCCGGRMEKAYAGNPNMCPGCAQLLEDPSPLLAVRDMDCDSEPRQGSETLSAELLASGGSRHPGTGS